MHGVLWSLSLNILAYIVLSLLRQPSSIERLQAEVFVPNELTPMTPTFRRWRSTVTVQDILSTVAQYLGPERARESFEAFAASHRVSLEPAASADFELLQHAEHLIASSIGAASSRLVMSLLLRKRTVSARAALKLLDDSHAALHFNREMLQTALNHVRQGIAVFNPDLQLICSNRQFGEILGLPPHLVQIGIPLREILEFLGAISPPGFGDNDALMDMRLTAYTTEGEPYLERLPDRHMVIEVRANRMPGGGLVITFSDVTPSFEAAEALERANATLEKRVRDRTEELTRLNSELALAKSAAEDASISKTRFLAAASHDILQPLNAARLYVTSLVERQNGGEDSRLVENIDDSLEAIEEILGALLDISRLDAGAMKPSITSFRIGDLMRSLEIEFAPVARAKGLRLTFVPSSLPVESDRLMLRRLLQNLISNAIKYTPQGRVLIGCRRRGTALQICVYDTGVGVPLLKRGEIFKEFHRLEQGARIARGLGLGLSIVERLARVLNHGIALDANVSGGSFFSVTVPVAKTITFTAAVTSATPLSKAPMSGTLIVCIENDPAILDGMKTLLTAWDAKVIAVSDPEAAIAAIEAAGERVTGLLVDYHLDRGNGVAAIRDIRHRFGESIPAILITADRSPNVRLAARQEKIAVLNKPVKPASLRALLGQWRAQQQVASGIGADRVRSRARSGAGPPLAACDFRCGDHRLRAAFDAEFLQDRGDVRLDRRFRHAELIGDLLVEQAFRQHHQHAHLLRGQRHQPVAQPRHVGIGGGCEIDVGRDPDIAVHDLQDRVAQRLDPETLGNEPRGAEIQRSPYGSDIVAGGHDHDGDRRILRAQIDQPGKTADSRHGQIEQDQIDIGILFQQRGEFFERAGVVDFRGSHDARNRLSQRVAKQRMVIGNDEVRAGGGGHLRLAIRLRQTRDPFVKACEASSSRTIVLCRAVRCKRPSAAARQSG